MSCLVERIVSGGQTGADRAALDWAIEHGVAHGGWCPKGRKAEDGTIEVRYNLQEMPTAEYAGRTEKNVLDSDGTVIISLEPELNGGSAGTREIARRYGKPFLHITAADGVEEAGRILREFVVKNGISTLNVAGPRASEEPTVGEFVKLVLRKALSD